MPGFSRTGMQKFLSLPYFAGEILLLSLPYWSLRIILTLPHVGVCEMEFGA